MTDEPCCARCRFSRLDREFANDPAASNPSDLDNHAMVWCHRHAPPIITVRDRDLNEHAETEWKWPMLLPEDWCGDFSPKATA